MLAVSQKVMPSSTVCRKIGSAAVSSSTHGMRFAGSPKLMQPRAMRLTFRPEVPRRVYSMNNYLCLSGSVCPTPLTAVLLGSASAQWWRSPCGVGRAILDAWAESDAARSSRTIASYSALPGSAWYTTMRWPGAPSSCRDW